MTKNQKPYDLRKSTTSNKISYREVDNKEIVARKNVLTNAVITSCQRAS